jgi:hypothetical protein
MPVGSWCMICEAAVGLKNEVPMRDQSVTAATAASATISTAYWMPRAVRAR